MGAACRVQLLRLLIRVIPAVLVFITGQRKTSDDGEADGGGKKKERGAKEVIIDGGMGFEVVEKPVENQLSTRCKRLENSIEAWIYSLSFCFQPPKHCYRWRTESPRGESYRRDTEAMDRVVDKVSSKRAWCHKCALK